MAGTSVRLDCRSMWDKEAGSHQVMEEAGAVVFRLWLGSHRLALESTRNWGLVSWCCLENRIFAVILVCVPLVVPLRTFLPCG